jgi:hypothetical protein
MAGAAGMAAEVAGMAAEVAGTAVAGMAAVGVALAWAPLLAWVQPR